MSAVAIACASAASLAVAALLIRRRLRRLDRQSAMMWARNGARRATRDTREAWRDRAKLVSSDAERGPRIEARLSGIEARFAELEAKSEASDEPALAEELRALEKEAEALARLVAAVQSVRDYARYPRQSIEAIELRVREKLARTEGEQRKAPGKGPGKAPGKVPVQARELRVRLDRLEAERVAFEARCLDGDELAGEQDRQQLRDAGEALCASYRKLGDAAHPLWQRLYPVENKQREKESAAFITGLLAFNERFREEQERERAELEAITERESDREGDDEDWLL